MEIPAGDAREAAPSWNDHDGPKAINEGYSLIGWYNIPEKKGNL